MGDTDMSAVVAASTGAARASRFPAVFLISSLTLGVVAGATFLAFPEIDLMVSRAFYSGNGNFDGQSAFLVIGLRIGCSWRSASPWGRGLSPISC
jgi:hypothetical protein